MLELRDFGSVAGRVAFGFTQAVLRKSYIGEKIPKLGAKILGTEYALESICYASAGASQTWLQSPDTGG
jgi:hypothetical protein